MGGKSRKGGKKAAAAARRKAKEEAKKKKEAEAAAATAAAAAGAAGAGAGGGAGGGAGASSTNGTPAGGGKIKPGSALHIMLQGVTCTSAKAKYSHANTRDIKVHNLSLALYGSELLMETELTLNWGRRYAIIGPNGCGKSTLLTVIGQRMVPLPRNIDVFHVREEIEPLKDVTALEAVLAVDTEREMLEKEAEDLGENLATLDDDAALEVNERLCEIYERLDEMGADTAKVRAAKLLWGLGFTKEMQATVCADFSGGWRMRIALARALFINPSLLLLDEPTNHLDMEAVVWLENYLAAHKKILLMVSHSQDFLNNVCTNIITVQSQKIVSYAGNYDTYRQTREEIEENQMKRYNWEQDQIKHMKDYIARFGHGSAKLAKQAQSKEKTLAKMERAGLTKKVVSERALSFEFPDPGKIPPPVLQIQNISFHYPGGPLLYNNVDFGVDLDSRIALVGPNGAGKTTMLKLMCGLLTPTQGTVRAHEHLRIARYTQHFVDSLDVSMTPLELMMKRYPDETREQCRSYIGRYGITGVYQTRKIDLLSDGLKSRVVFAFMSRTTPHLLLLDEPTNHLDIETIDALAEAINKFEGGLVLVSHDMRLISQVAKEIWECDHRTMTRFNGDILEYKLELAKRMQQEEAAREKAEERAKEKAKAKAKAAKARS